MKSFKTILGCLFLFFAHHLSASLSQDDKEILAKDQAAYKKYLAHFPEKKYTICDIPGQGKFYVDDIDDVIKSFLRKGVVWESHIQGLAKQYIRPGSIAIDAGAHIGTHTIPMAEYVGPEGKVYAFEPQRKIFRELYWNCKLNKVKNVKAFRLGLGANHQIAYMEPTLKGNEAGTGIGCVKGTELVEVRTLDSFKLNNVSVLKVDVERYEDDFLLGAKKTILRNKPVIIIEIMGGYAYSWAPDDIKAKINNTKLTLVNMGYEVHYLGGADYLALPK